MNAKPSDKNINTIIGIDLGGTNIKSGKITMAGEILDKKSRPTQAHEGFKIVYDNIKNSIVEFISSDVIGIGLGSPGWIRIREGIIGGGCENIPCLNGVGLKLLLEKDFHVPVYIDNDANNHLKGEYLFGAAKGYHNILLITLGTGIGGGLILDNKFYHGDWDYAGEIGHMTLIPDGRFCNCGNKGCFEAYASAPAMILNANTYLAKEIPTKLLEYNKEQISSKLICDLAKEGDKVCLQVIDDTAKYIGIMLGSVLNLLNLDLILIGGGVAAAGELLMSPIKFYTQSYCLKNAFNGIEIKQAALGNDAGIMGSAAMVLLEGTTS